MLTAHGEPELTGSVIWEKQISYSWTEQEIAGYTLVRTETTGDVTVFTNRLITVPENQPDTPQADIPREPMVLDEFEDYRTALGVSIVINQVGDCFD